MNRKIKVGVFGAHRGLAMIQVLAGHPDAELVAICDRYEPLLEKCRTVARDSNINVAFYTSFSEFKQHEMDAVVLANYANEHAPFAIELLGQGIHVCSEVLPVETMAQAVELVEAVEKSGRIYTYAENYCYFRSTQEMKRLYREGAIGEFLHAEGEYVHDCESIWPDITYGERDHWRNRLYSTYYCTHSLGPVIAITGAKVSRIVGFETPNVPNMARQGYRGGTSGLIVAQMDNGATVKSLHGYLKREPSSVWYSLYGTTGMMETDRWNEGVDRLYLYQEGSSNSDTAISYRPKAAVDLPQANQDWGHGGSDFYTMHYFLEKILGRPAGEACIDVYQALDMALPGILAYRSICSGNVPVDVPDFRDPSAREAYRHDTWCTNPEVAGDMLAPFCSKGETMIPDSVYTEVRNKWLEHQKGLL
ncbi:MAG: Gfo/Idh/MocA family oxidoreductase [Eubacteriales bacterium]|nr:Gfo/Idh/MocA family oxidoreductase [Eubacteriales bacterium]